jgi:hypothetical protein
VPCLVGRVPDQDHPGRPGGAARSSIDPRVSDVEHLTRLDPEAHGSQQQRVGGGLRIEILVA